MADELENIKWLIGLNRRNIEKAIQANINRGVEALRTDIRRLKRAAYEQHNVIIADLPGIDFDDPRLDREITIKIKLSLYIKIRNIVAQYGIKLPEVE